MTEPVFLSSMIDPEWRSVSSGIHKLEDKILVILDIEQLLRKAGEKLRS